MEDNKDDKSGLAVAGMVLGITSLVFLGLVPVSLICSIVGLIISNKARRSSARKGMATAGFVCSIIGLVIVIGFILFGFGMAALIEYQTSQSISDGSTQTIEDLGSVILPLIYRF